jgi:hypothetical protein
VTGLEQRISGTRSRRAVGNTGARGNKKLLRNRCDTFTANTRKEEGLSIKSEEEQATGLVLARHTPLFQPPVNTGWDEPALCRFFADFMMDTDNLKVNPGFLHNLSRLFSEATAQDELLVKAVRAVSLANFCNQSGSDHFLIKSRNAYSQSLALLKRDLSDGNLTIVSTLAGVLLLNMYDVKVPASNCSQLKLTCGLRCTAVKSQ